MVSVAVHTRITSIMKIIIILYVCCGDRCDDPTIQVDSKVSKKIICEVIPKANVQVCTFHWLRLVCPMVSMLVRLGVALLEELSVK
jgi:hypothetical protein